MIGQSWSFVFKSVVRRGRIEEGVLDLQVTLTALSICLQWTEALSCLLSLLPVYKTDTDIIRNPTVRKEVCGAAEASTVIHTACMCPCQSLNPGL